jgi:hypothetical protein
LGFHGTLPNFIHPDSIRYYDTKVPLTEAQFLLGYKRGQTFSILHSQNIGPRVNAALYFRRVNSLGQYAYQQQLMNDFQVTARFATPRNIYSGRVYLNLALNPSQQNGGLVSDTAFGAINQGDRTVEPVRLQADARSRRRTATLDHQVQLLQIGTDSLGNGGWKSGLYHTALLQKDLLAFVSDTSSFLPPPRFSLQTADSTSLEDLQTTGGLWLQSGPFQFKAGAGYLFQRYGGTYFQTTGDQVLVEGSGRYLHKHWLIQAEVRQSVAGSLDPATSLDGSVGYAWGPWTATGRVTYNNRAADWLLRYQNSNLSFWDLRNSVRNVQTTRWMAQLSHQRWGSFSITGFQTQNWMYLNASALPEQFQNTIQVLQLHWSGDYPIWRGLHLAPQVTRQETSTPSVLPLPQWVARAQLYYQMNFFKNALKTMWGLDARYFSAYQATVYVPYMDAFQLQNDRSVGNYPLLTAFVAFKIDDFTFHAMAEHINRGWMGFDYFVTPQYPLPDLNLRVSLTWRFFD